MNKYSITFEEYKEHYETIMGANNRLELLQQNTKTPLPSSHATPTPQLPINDEVFSYQWDLSGRVRYANTNMKKVVQHRFNRPDSPEMLVNFYGYDEQKIKGRETPFTIRERILKLITAALFRPVEQLCHGHRMALMNAFDDEGIWNFGTRRTLLTAVKSSKTIDMPELCALLMFLQDKVLQNVHYTYMSAKKMDLWGFKYGYNYGGENGAVNVAPIKRSGDRDVIQNIDPEETDYYDEFNELSVPMECSALTESLAELYYTFGVPFSSMKMLRLGSFAGGYSLVMTKPPSEEARKNINGIPGDKTPPFGSGLINYPVNKEFYPHLFFERLEDVIKDKEKDWKKKISWDSRAEISRWISKNVKPTLRLDDEGNFHPLTMDVFQNHYILEVMNDIGSSKSRFDRAPRFFDMLYKQRYKNGASDFLDTFILKEAHHKGRPGKHADGDEAWYMYGVEEYWLIGNNLRRIYSLPMDLYPKIRSNVLDGGGLFSRFKFQHEEAFRAMTDLNRPDNKKFIGYPEEANRLRESFRSNDSKSLDIVSMMFGRYNTLFLYIHEADWSRGRISNHPQKVIDLLGPYISS